MDAAAVYEAVRTIRQRLDQAISFSTSRENYAGIHKIPGEKLQQYWKLHAARHRRWQSNIKRALRSLQDEKYPFPPEWHNIDVSTPQIAFSSVPLDQQHGCRNANIWVLGGGENLIGELANPIGDKLSAGEWQQFDPDGPEVNDLAGAFDDSLVREWEELLPIIEGIERRIWELIATGGMETTEQFDEDTLPPRQQKILHIIDKYECVETLSELADKWNEVYGTAKTADSFKHDAKELKRAGHLVPFQGNRGLTRPR